MADFSTIVRRARERHGWDQAELARRLGGIVSQQTISSWEGRRTRPRREVLVRLAGVFALKPQELLAAAGYSPLTDRPVANADKPVRPLLTVLPLDQLSPGKFEELIADVAQEMFPGMLVTRFGGQGHEQAGYDVVVQAHTRYVAAFQCKRQKAFGPRNVSDAIGKVRFSVEAPYLVLSRPVASPQSRREMLSHLHWRLWDGEDVSRFIRTLPSEAKLRIVDTYFPGWRGPFLGVDEPGPWLTSQDFFRPLTVGSIYTHRWQLVGRRQELAEIISFAQADSPAIGLLIGRGGIGKSRLLRETADRLEDSSVKVRFVRSILGLRPEHFELLPSDQKVLVIVDDAHIESVDPRAWLGDLFRVRPNAKVLFALRPYGFKSIERDLMEIGVSAVDVPQWRLSDLAASDAVALANEALGTKDSMLAGRLGRISADCPFITVVAGVLIQTGQLNPACLDHEETIRSQVLLKFRDVVVEDPVRSDGGTRRATLDAISVLQPFRSDDLAFQQSVSALVEQPYDRISLQIRALEEAGVLLRRESALRIVPDLLGDVVLAQACFDEAARVPTGFINRAWAAAEGDAAQSVLVNASRIDWHVQHDYPGAQSLIDSLWDNFEESLQIAGIRGRTAGLKLLEKVSFFNPSRALEIVTWLLENPTDLVEPASEPLLRLFRPSTADVTHALTPVIRTTAYHIDCLTQAAELLWRLGRDDRRALNPHPDHPIRVLQGLAELDPTKPITYNHALVDVADRWLAESRGDTAYSPFDVLEPMLATEGTTTTAEGWQVRLQSFLITPQSVEPLRRRVFDLALRELKSGGIRQAYRAVNLIESGLHYPVGMLGQQVSPKVRTDWTPSFVAALGRLREVVATTPLEPFIGVALRGAMHTHVMSSSSSTRATSEAALEVLSILPDTLEDRLAMALFDGWGRLSTVQSDNAQEQDADFDARISRLTSDLVNHSTRQAIIDMISARLAIQSEAVTSGRYGDPGPFLWRLVRAHPELGEEICARVAVQPSSPLVQGLAQVISAWSESEPRQAMLAIRPILDSGTVEARRAVAHALGWARGGRRAFCDEELQVLTGLATDADTFVRSAAARSAILLAPHRRADALDLLVSIPFADSREVAEAVLQGFSPSEGLDWGTLVESRRTRLLDELRLCSSIDSYSIELFLAEQSKVDAATIVTLLMQRIEYWEKLDASNLYRPLPFHWSHPLAVNRARDLNQILRGLLEWLGKSSTSWRRQDAGAQLFVDVAGGFDATVKKVLDDALSKRDEPTFTAVASIIRRAPRQFVYEEVDFVCGALAAGAALGNDSLRRIGEAFHASSISGVRWGSPGQPFREDLEQAQRSQAIAKTLTPGSEEERFYRLLEQSANQSIRWHDLQDDRIIDGRDW